MPSLLTLEKFLFHRNNNYHSGIFSGLVPASHRNYTIGEAEWAFDFLLGPIPYFFLFSSLHTTQYSRNPSSGVLIAGRVRRTSSDAQTPGVKCQHLFFAISSIRQSSMFFFRLSCHRSIFKHSLPANNYERERERENASANPSSIMASMDWHTGSCTQSRALTMDIYYLWDHRFPRIVGQHHHQWHDSRNKITTRILYHTVVSTQYH